MQRKMKTKEAPKNIQIKIKNRRITLCKPKTKHETNRIHHNRTKTSKHRIQIIRNRTQPKKNIQ